MKKPLTPSRSKRSGFSLPEVILAIGIAGTVLVALFGLLPLGFDTLEESADLSVRARITEEMIGAAQAAEWSKVSTLDEVERPYDAFGQGVDETETSKVIYVASYRVGDKLDPRVRLPGADQASRIGHARRIEVYIRHVPTGKTVREATTIISRYDRLVDDRGA